MSKGEEFEKFALRNGSRYIGWYRDMFTELFLASIKDDIENYTSMLKYVDMNKPGEMAKIQGSIQILEGLTNSLEKVFERITKPFEPEDDDDDGY